MGATGSSVRRISDHRTKWVRYHSPSTDKFSLS